MHTEPPEIPAEFVVPLNMNGLRGRLLRLPAKRAKYNREILLVQGHHTSLERWYGFAEALNEYGAITMPDMPGFGGMDSFYKIGEKPDLDTMADYLASVVKLRFKNRRITIAAISYGFLVATRMLQRYPEIAKKTDIICSLAGFTHHEDFKYSKRQKFLYRILARAFSGRISASLFRNIFLHPSILRAVYHRTVNAKHKFEGYSEEQRRALTEFEIVLWRINDVRTWTATTYAMMKLDNCQKQVDLPVHHVGSEADHYFDPNIVEQHMRVVFNDFITHKTKLDRHVPNILADKKEASKIFPASVKKLFRT